MFIIRVVKDLHTPGWFEARLLDGQGNLLLKERSDSVSSAIGFVVQMALHEGPAVLKGTHLTLVKIVYE
jgi:hypothetical protein